MDDLPARGSCRRRGTFTSRQQPRRVVALTLWVTRRGWYRRIPRAGAQAQDYAPLDAPLVVEQVPGRPIYYFCRQSRRSGRANQGNTSNAGFVVTSDGVVVFDALGTPSLGLAMLQEIRERTDAPVRYNVVSHYHADHIYGLQAFSDHSAPVIIAQDRAREYKERTRRPPTSAPASGSISVAQALAPWVNENTRVVPPDITFNDRMTLTLGGKRFQMIYAGPAHSASDMMMMVEPDGVLFAGDIVQNGRIPFMNSDDVDTGQWLQAPRGGGEARSEIHHPGPRPAVDRRQGSDRLHPRLHPICPRRPWARRCENWTDFDVAYRQTDWSKYAGHASVRRQQPRQRLSHLSGAGEDPVPALERAREAQRLRFRKDSIGAVARERGRSYIVWSMHIGMPNRVEHR